MKYRRGLSFVEVMYSILLLATTLVILSRISSQSSVQLDRSKRYYLIAQLMENQLSELEFQYQQEGAKALEEIEKEPFENYPNFSWSLTTQPVEDLKLSTLEDSSLAGSDMVSKAVTDIKKQIAKLITEVQLTIHYTKNKQETNYSITTYFVDFKKGKSNTFLQQIIPQFSSLQGTR